VLVVGTCSLAVIVGLRRLAPGAPGPLVAVAGAIAAVNALALDVPTVGSIASGLSSFGLPDIGLADFGRLAGGGLGVMLIAFAEGLGAAKAYAGRDDRRIDASRELVALGGANLAAGVSSGMVVSGSLSKTAVGPRPARAPRSRGSWRRASPSSRCSSSPASSRISRPRRSRRSSSLR
jgi:MFS superfamily sulfate permease-like transporter